MASPASHHPGQPTIPPHRSGTLLDMPDPPPPVLGGAQPALGESPPTQAVDVFGGPPPSHGAPQFQFDGPSGSMPVHNNALTMPPPTGYGAEEPAPKRSSMKFVLLAACAASALILSVAGYVAVSGNRRAQSSASQAAIRAPHPPAAARAAAPPAAAQPAVAPVAQPLAAAPVAQALAPSAPPAEAAPAQVLAALAAAPQPPAEATPPTASGEPAQAANEPDERENRRGRRVRRAQPAEAPAAQPRAVAARAARPAAQPAAAARPARPARVRRGPITEVPF